ncbi:hypothetical protein NM208_g14217 [Fusarium decemcellulare]|uniref:Uncharacterized protein n=1 Tax=Fusarium decemcellulare TaxID=57161 RepID=A0ACC1RHH4_9HYPO|nr:hypothetical protein NM208_g14217 [Fusarium decemcellulare]
MSASLPVVPDTMRTWQYSSVEGKLEDYLTIVEVPVPSPSSLAKGQLLVEIISASINPVDYKLPESGIIGRLMISRPATPGLDFCGRIIAKHPSVTAFETGQLVFGGFTQANPMGTLGQYTVTSSGFCALVPAGIDPDQAAAVGTAATTAYQSLMPDSLEPGATIFINGGSGGVGTWAIQEAKALGAQVVTTCSTGNVELCRQLGADEVLDYKKVDIISDLKSRGNVFDLVVDNVGSSTELYDTSPSLLKPGGTFVQVGVGEAMTASGVASSLKKQFVPTFIRGGPRYYFVNMKNTSEFFGRIGSWMAEGKARAIVDETYEWKDVPAAFRRLREGHVRGKIVIHVSKRVKSDI